MYFSVGNVPNMNYDKSNLTMNFCEFIPYLKYYSMYVPIYFYPLQCYINQCHIIISFCL